MGRMYASLMPDLVGVDVSPRQSISLAAEHGFAGVDLRLARHLDRIESDGVDRLADHMSRCGVRAGYASMLTRTLSAPEGEWESMRRRLPRIAAVARQLGYTRAGVVVLPFDDQLDFAANRRRHLDRLGQVAPVLADHGIRLGLEYVAPRSRRADATFTFVHDMSGMLELLDAADADNLGLMLDSFHWHAAAETTRQIAQLPAERIVVVHVNDAPADCPRIRLDIRDRELPGATGQIDLAGMMRALAAADYDGPVTAEPTNARWPQMPAERVLSQTAAAVSAAVDLAYSATSPEGSA